MLVLLEYSASITALHDPQNLHHLTNMIILVQVFIIL